MTHHDDSLGGADGTVLSRCVARTADEFAAEYWGRTPLLTRAAELPGPFTDLLSPAAVDELLSERGLRTPFLRMAKAGSVLPTAKFTRSGGAGATIADQVADDKVLALMSDGATAVLQALHRTWPPLIEFGSRLSDELGHPVQINAYITPPGNQGFKPHYDVHDVFALQVSGHKRWVVWEPVFPDPLSTHPWDGRKAEVVERADQPPLFDVVLGPGDALYLPRGTVHAAQALDDTSVHLTVGVHPLTRYDLVTRLLADAAADPALRKSLPVGADLSDPAVLAPHLAATVQALRARLEHVSAASQAEALGRVLADRTRPEAIGPLVQLATADELGVDTPVRRRRGLRLREERVDDAVRLSHLDRSVTLAENAGDALKVLLSGRPCTPSDLPGLDPDGQLDLVRRLLREGFVVPASAP